MPPAPLPAFEEARLKSLKSIGLLDSPRSADLDDLVSVAAKMMDMPVARLSLITETKQRFKSSYGPCDTEETPRDQAFCAYAILAPNETLIINDATCDDRVAENPRVTGSPWIRSYVGVPLLSKDNLPIGTLCVYDSKPRYFTSSQIVKFQELARAVSNNIRLHAIVNQLKKK